MNSELVCSVRKNIITIFDDEKQLFVNTRVVKYTPNNVFHLGRKFPVVTEYLKNGKHDLGMSDIRKKAISRINFIRIKHIAIENVQTKIDTNKLKYNEI